MRLWTLHPRYLDSRGLVALWREGLLAQAVLAGRTNGYRHHPQLHRFRDQIDPLTAIGTYLQMVHKESQARGYTFDVSKIHRLESAASIVETEGQILFEWEHLERKLAKRDYEQWRQNKSIGFPEPHPLFRLEPGPVREWELGSKL